MFGNQNLSMAQRLSKIRGKAPQGKRFISSSVYIPGGPTCNVQPAKIRNLLITENVHVMHERWLATFKARQAAKA